MADRPVTLVELGISNLGSVVEAFRRVGGSVALATTPDEVACAGALVLPGVGAFGDGAAALARLGLVEPIRAHAAAGKPLLGICLGMQLLADESEEHGRHAGLGLVPGRVVRRAPDDPALRVPNMGWGDVRPAGASGLLVDEGCFYFAHSFRFAAADAADAAGVLDYGGEVVAAVARGSVRGVQFHPEKSQDDGLGLLDRWLAEAA
ncbi:MAG: imidazole glycerol phosphate synthase subunit HisH [Thermoleophilia bacterium]